jgi:cytochrome b561
VNNDISVNLGDSASAIRYDKTSIWLHWITAVSVVALWGLGQGIDFFPRGTPRLAARSVHILLGGTLGALLMGRILWRMRWGRRLPRATPRFMGYLATLTHWILYGLVAATVILGVANAWIRGDTIIWLGKIPSLAPGDRELRGLIEDLHSTAANIIMIAAGLHAGAALVHHFVLRDKVLRRMLLRRLVHPNRCELLGD